MTPESPFPVIVAYHKRDQENKVNLRLPNSNLTILMVDAGYLYIQLNGGGMALDSKDIFILTGIFAHSVRIENNTADLWVLSLNPGSLFGESHLGTGSTFLAFLDAVGYTKVSPRSMDSTTLTQWFRLLINKNSIYTSELERQHVFSWNLRSFFQELGEIYFMNLTKPEKGWHQNHKLVFRFLQTVEIHFKSQHSVNWYADELLVSADHLSKVVKKITRKSAKQCIEERLLVAAKSMLLKNAPIHRIWNLLGFQTSSHFGFFFKKYTSMSPSAYRKQSFSKE